jgi:hypothetical protein
MSDRIYEILLQAIAERYPTENDQSIANSTNGTPISNIGSLKSISIRY